MLLKYSVDGSHGESYGGASGPAAAHGRRMDFCRYLSARQMSIDIWDGDSLLQIGTSSLGLKPLLRQV